MQWLIAHEANAKSDMKTKHKLDGSMEGDRISNTSIKKVKCVVG
jgi:hypothetical protein